MKTQHTPYPWQILIKRNEDDETGFYIRQHVETGLAMCKESYWPENYNPPQDGYFYYQPDENADIDLTKIANARLIAVAPDMLFEIKKQIAWLEHVKTDMSFQLLPSSIQMGFDQSIKYLKQTVNKAEGQ
jgi:hypothetical protein